MLWTTIGFALVILDVLFIPGGLFVLIGSLVILYGVYLNYEANGLIPAMIHFALCLAIMPKLILYSLNRLSLKKEMSKEEGFVGVEDHQSLIGKKGVAWSDLRPSGSVVIDIDGEQERLDCISEGGYIDKGAEVVIVEERGPSLVVHPSDFGSHP